MSRTKIKKLKTNMRNEEFAVFYDRLDNEHKILFDNMRAVEMDPMSRTKIKKLKTNMRNHFIYEEKQFCNSKDIDWDYCETHKMKHTKFSHRLADIRAPADKSEIKWAQDWFVQHVQNTLELSHTPNDADKLTELKKLYRDHFDYEEGKFCEIPNFACTEHKLKHYKFWVLFEQMQVPVGCEELNWTKQWFAQHIKNTDHQYKGRFLSDP